MPQQAIVTAARQMIEDIQATGHYTCFEYAGISSGYYSDEGDAAEWMTRLFEGYFTASDKRAVDARIYGTADAELFASLQRLSSGQPVLAKDEYVDAPLTEDVALIHTRATKVTPLEDVYHLLFPRERMIVLVTSGNLEVRQEESMQTLRALIKWLLIEKGWIPMHAACAAKDERVICITGEKASGKTSTLLNLLARNGCDLVAVDKFLMRDAGPHVEICGIPGKCGIRVGSATVHPRLLEWLAAETAPFFPNLGAEEVQRIAESNSPEQLRKRKEKIHLLATELTRLLGTSITPIAPLGLVLVPIFDLSVAEWRLRPCEREQANRTLLASYAGLLSKGEGFLLHFFDLTDAMLKERLAILLSKHVQTVPMYELHQNHQTNEQSAELVADLIG